MQDCKAKLSALKSKNSRALDGSTDSNSDGQNLQFQKGQVLLSALQNAVVVVGFAFFAYAVRYVLQSI